MGSVRDQRNWLMSVYLCQRICDTPLVKSIFRGDADLLGSSRSGRRSISGPSPAFGGATRPLLWRTGRDAVAALNEGPAIRAIGRDIIFAAALHPTCLARSESCREWMLALLASQLGAALRTCCE